MNTYPIPDQLNLPCEPYDLGDFHRFGTHVPSRIWHATHLGDDINVPSGTRVKAIGDGQVVLSRMQLGNQEKRNWGGVVIIAHIHKKTGHPFYSVYGHMTNLQVKQGDTTVAGQELGSIAAGLTPDNGWWIHPHLHFALYTGPWTGALLPGYKRIREFWRTRVSWWHDPRPFIQEYNRDELA